MESQNGSLSFKAQGSNLRYNWRLKIREKNGKGISKLHKLGILIRQRTQT